MVGAAGASAVALDSFKAGDGIGYLHSGNKRAYSLQVAIAAGGEADAFYNVIGCFYVNKFRADKGAGLERGAADAVFGIIGYQGYVKHSSDFLILQRYGFYRWFGWSLVREDAGDFSGWWRLCIFGTVVEIKVLFSMKKFWKILIICVVALGVMAVTCPSKHRHVDAGVKYMSKALHKQAKTLEKTYKEQHNNQEMPDEGKQLMVKLQESLISQMKPAVENVLEVKNYVLFSVGQFVNETDGVMTASVGVLGMVFPNKKVLKTDLNLNFN